MRECTRYNRCVLRGRWFGWALGALGLAGASHCAGNAERNPHDAAGSSGETGSQTSLGTGGVSADGTGIAVGGGPTQSSASTGGAGDVPNILEACPDLVDRLPCGAEFYVGDMSHAELVRDEQESSCEFSVVNEFDQLAAPLVVVDCEPVRRFGEGGGAGWNDELEHYAWDPDTNTFTFFGPWCEELANGQRVDVVYACGPPL